MTRGSPEHARPAGRSRRCRDQQPRTPVALWGQTPSESQIRDDSFSYRLRGDEASRWRLCHGPPGAGLSFWRRTEGRREWSPGHLACSALGTADPVVPAGGAEDGALGRRSSRAPCAAGRAALPAKLVRRLARAGETHRDALAGPGARVCRGFPGGDPGGRGWRVGRRARRRSCRPPRCFCGRPIPPA